MNKPTQETKIKNMPSKHYRIIPSYAYNPAPKPPSRRDLIRAGIIKRNGQPGKNAYE